MKRALQFRADSRAVQVEPELLEVKILPVPTTATSLRPLAEEATLTQFLLDDFALHEEPLFDEM